MLPIPFATCRSFILLSLGLALSACLVPSKGDDDGSNGGSDAGFGDDGGADGGDDGGDDVVSCSSVANLELVPLDIWGRDLDDSTLMLDASPELVEDDDSGPGVQIIALDSSPSEVELRIEADEHDDLELIISHDGSGGFEMSEPKAGRFATSSEVRTIDGEDCPIFTVYAGLDHTWMAAQGRAPTLNEVDFLMDGEEFWESVAEELDGASDRVSWATWWWTSDFELTRPDWDVDLSESDRWENTIMGRMEDMGGVERRVLINRFWDENSDWAEYLNTDSELRDVAEETGDDFEVMLQGNATEVEIYGSYEGEVASWSFVDRVADNPRYDDRYLDLPPVAPVSLNLSVQVASWHQKFMVFDGEVAFVTGMNTKSSDWDTSSHEVFNPNRMDFDADMDDREDVYWGESYPDLGPRKDYGARIEGPAAYDAEEIFWERWEAGIDGDDMYSEAASSFSLDAAASEPAGGVLTQVVATMPEPWGDMSIAETHAKAIRQAENYIFIEDQYFRSPIMEEAVHDAMEANSDLVLIVVTKPVSSLDGGSKYTWLAHDSFLSAYPDRYLLLQLRTWALVLEEGWVYDEAWLAAEDMDTHSKLRIIDDRYVSLGSCNWNNRGYLYEGEVNVSVLDTAFAQDARERVFENLVGPDWEDYLSDDGQNNLDVLALAAESNEEIEEWWVENDWDLDLDEAEDTWDVYRPSGFVLPLEIEDDYWFDVGPDAF
jgi:phosphatidylserine/phosphatidylglycerophosphate/cardiolipin synthase-like enzyme